MTPRSDSVDGFGWQRGTSRIVVWCLLAAITLASLAPFGFLVLASFKASGNSPPGGLWVELVTRVPVLRYMINSAVISLGATAIGLAVSSMAGYSFAKLPFPLRGALFGLIVGAISIPLATTILPNYLNFARLGGIGSYWAPILIYAALSTPFSTVLMTSFFRSIPDELIESAVIDGASYRQIYGFVMLRLAGPAFVTVGVLTFLGTWNDLLVALLFLPNPENRTISAGIAALQNVRAMNSDLLLTGSLLSAIPPVLAFIFCQRYLVTGLTAGMSR
jgi:ABC-type glycerol-3-phosphate transport system permease component